MAGLTTGNGFPNVVVTGYAMTTALATDAEGTWKRLLDGESGIRTLDDYFVELYDLPVRIGGHLLEDFESELTRVELRRLSYLQKMATVIGRRAWDHAGAPEVDTKRLMVSIGTGMGSSEELLYAYDGMRAKGLKAVSPLAVQMYMPNSPAAAVGSGTQRQGRRHHAHLRVRIGLGGHRERMAQHRPRRGGHGDLRRRGDQDRSGPDRRVRADAHRALHHQRRSGWRLPPVRQGPQRLRLRRGRGADDHRNRGARRGARGQHPGTADGCRRSPRTGTTSWRPTPPATRPGTR